MFINHCTAGGPDMRSTRPLVELPKPKPKFIIGIDTGVNTGFAVWDKEKRKLIIIEVVKIHTAMQWIQDTNVANHGFIKVRIEDARLRKWIPRQKNARDEAGMREGAGSIKRDAIIWEDYLTDIGIEFELVAPKDNKTKIKSDYFARLTGWAKKTNEHGRDAAMLVFGY